MCNDAKTDVFMGLLLKKRQSQEAMDRLIKERRSAQAAAEAK
jgi:hypothetical protein